MNIFYLDRSPILAAIYQCDKHVVKMIVESAQLMCTAVRMFEGFPGLIWREKTVKVVDDYGNIVKTKKLVLVEYEYCHSTDNVWQDGTMTMGKLYFTTHINHPSATWVRESKHNYKWLYDHWINLMKEYTFRYEKIHKCFGLNDLLKKIPRGISSNEFTDPPQCMPDLYKCGDTVTAYRNYYLEDKSRFAKWNKSRSAPDFWATSSTG